jgi:amino acid adenylation domain-containing protein
MDPLHRRLDALSPAQWKLLLQRLRQQSASPAEGSAAQRLIAYVVPGEAAPSAEELRAFLREHVPGYMIPAAFQLLDELPRTPSGKIDRQRLPRTTTDTLAAPHRAPQSPVEEIIVAIWAALLAHEPIGRHDDFFALGGHSLLATQAVARMREAFAIELPLRALFEHPTPARLAAHIQTRMTDAARIERSPILPRATDERLPLSFAQQRLWFLEHLDPTGAAYNLCQAVRLIGRLDVAALRRSIEEIIERHEILRTSFPEPEIDGQPIQRIHDHARCDVPVLDLSALAHAAALERARALAHEAAERPFDLAHGPLLRTFLVAISASEHVLVVVAHHIVVDGWSIGNFISELAALYDDFSLGHPSRLPPLPVQYADYALWHRRWLEDGAAAAQMRYWHEQLRGAPPFLELPTDRPRPAIQSARGGTVPIVIPAPLLAELRALSRAEGATLFITLLAAFQALLYRYTEQDDIVIGTPVANRTHVQTEALIGCFVNTLALRTDLSGDPTFRALVRRVREVALGGFAHQDLPFERLVQELQVPRDLGRAPVFQVMFSLQNFSPVVGELRGLRMEPLPIARHAANFDLELILEDGEEARGIIEYSLDLFDAATIERLAEHFLVLLRGAVADPGQRIARLPLLTEAEQRRLVVERNRTARPWPAEPCFPTLLEQQVERTPDAVAVTCRDRALTYAALAAHAGAIAAQLDEVGVRPEGVVGVMLDRGVEFLAAMLGVFRAGAVYTPFDPALPAQRLAHMAAHSQCRVLITDRGHAALAHGIADPLQARVLLFEELVTAAPATRRWPRLDPDRLAYIIFTSGSTGRPKGAMIPHRGMLNHLRAKIEAMNLTSRDVVAQQATQSFDVSVWQFLCALLVGGTTAVLHEEDAWEPVRLLGRLERDRVTVFETVPAHMRLILDELERAPGAYDLRALRWWMLNGEPLPPSMCARWFALHPDIPMINAYGPTECSDDVTHFFMTRTPEGPWRSVPISGAIGNLRLYVLDRNLELVPDGVTGELCIAGTGVGRGYVGEPARTAETFVPDPFATGERMYRSGDLVRGRPDGIIEILGRRDGQIKIRGVRIELGEIESALQRHGSVRECVVIAQQRGGRDKQLVAYVVLHPGARVDRAALVAHLEQQVAAAMVPSSFVFLDALPLLPSGKIDRKALPLPAGDEAPAHAEIAETEPETEIERKIAALWQTLLDAPRVGLDDDFFALGGHSLIAIQLISRLRTELGVEVAVKTIFNAPTVRHLARRIQGLPRIAPAAPVTQIATSRLQLAPGQRIPKVGARAHRALAAIQLPEWYMHELEPDSPFYNICSSNIVLRGALDLAAFTRAWQLLVDRHAVLRTVYDTVDGHPVQRVLPGLEIQVDDIYLDRTRIAEADIHDEIQRIASEYSGISLDFRRGPMFRIKLAELPGQRFLLVFLVHHICWDETSTMNLARELAGAYNALRAGRAPALPALRLDYVDYACWLNESIRSGALEHQRQYWLRRFADPPPALELPIDFPRPALQTFHGAEVRVLVPTALRHAIEQFLQDRKVTLYIFFLAVLGVHLHRLTGQDDLVVGTPIANRDDEELEGLLGLFATALPIRCQLSSARSFAEILDRTREVALEAYDNHLYPSVLAIQEIRPELDFSRNRLFSVMYGVQNNKNQLKARLGFDGLDIAFEPDIEVAESETAKFDLTYIVDHEDEDIVVRINYNTDLFTRATAQRMLDQLLALSEQAVRQPHTRVGGFRLLSPAEETALLRQCSAPSVDVTAASMLEPFAAQVTRAPQQTAVAWAGGSLSYRELDLASSRWSARLAALGVVAEERVALVLPASPELIVAQLAVWKAGGAYVPLSPALPPARQAQVLALAGARVVLTAGEQPVVDGPWQIVRMDPSQEPLPGADPLPGAAVPPCATVPPAARPAAQGLAYVLFTSGSTGVPKGIEIAHQGIVNLVESTQRCHRLRADDRLLFITSPAFDAAVLDVYWPLSAGATIVIPTDGTMRDPVALASQARQHGVTVFQAVPLVLDALHRARARGEISDIPSLRLVICGGAALRRELWDGFARGFGCRLANHYGPTEVTVDAARFLPGGEVISDIVPIGQPIDNAAIYILDGEGALVPPGVTGEIYVASPGLARGYLRDPALTAARFVPDPFSRAPGARMYRTMDLGRYGASGAIEFIGRVDNQVKVHGNRVELEDVEVVLSAHPAVARCLVQHLHALTGEDALGATIELQPSVHHITAGSLELRLFTLAQRPELRGAVDALHVGAWPAFFEGDCFLRQYWPRLPEDFPELQCVLVDPADRVLAAGNAAPIWWDGTVAGLPAGWDAALEQAFLGRERGIAPNTCLILTGVAAEEARGAGLAEAILRSLKTLAWGLGYERVIVPVRPTGKAARPELSFPEWCDARRDDGQPLDPWLRVHERIGGRRLKLDLASQHIRASIADWERWGQCTLARSGAYHIPGAMQPVRVDTASGHAEYFDPAVWMEHPRQPGEVGTFAHVDRTAICSFLRQHLPEYMVPQRVRFVPAMVLASSGKIDGRALPPWTPAAGARRFVAPRTEAQRQLARIWQEVLGLAQVGIHDDFFELGGHSIHAVRMLAMVQAAFEERVSLRELFLARTIEALATRIEALVTRIEALEAHGAMSSDRG